MHGMFTSNIHNYTDNHICLGMLQKPATAYLNTHLRRDSTSEGTGGDDENADMTGFIRVDSSDWEKTIHQRNMFLVSDPSSVITNY